MTSEPARCLPLSRSDGTLVRSSCPHRNTGSSRRVAVGGRAEPWDLLIPPQRLTGWTARWILTRGFDNSSFFLLLLFVIVLSDV